ncbi:MAG: helix-turn-helix domain-containing protein [Pseudomonadota bacterium]
MDAYLIKSETDYRRALAELETVFDAKPGTPEGDRMELLSILIDAYEQKHYPIDPPDPIEAILCRMDDLGLARKDLEPYIGGRSRVSEVLNRTRPLTIQMIRNLSEGLGIPAEVLIKPYPLRQDCA